MAIEKKPFEADKKLTRLKSVLIFAKKGHGQPISDILLGAGASMTTRFFAFGTKQTYVTDIFGGEEKNKEAILTMIAEDKYKELHKALQTYFSAYRNSQGVMLTFDVNSLAGVVAYKFLSDYEGADNYDKKGKE